MESPMYLWKVCMLENNIKMLTILSKNRVKNVQHNEENQISVDIFQ